MSHEDDYGNNEPVAYEVARYALRTFVIRDGQLSSVIKGGGHWNEGVCEAVCLAEDHEAPAPGCRCGIYGALSLQTLYSQYPKAASRIVAVIAAEGKTMLGTVGLRTAAARVVASGAPSQTTSTVMTSRSARCSAPAHAGSTMSR